MGSLSFSEHVRIPKHASEHDAFESAKRSAQHEHGHGGYTGTIAEKPGCTLICKVGSRKAAEDVAAGLMGVENLGFPLYRQEAQALVDDKWGNAGAIRYPIDTKEDGVLFFGYASY